MMEGNTRKMISRSEGADSLRGARAVATTNQRNSEDDQTCLVTPAG